jgi:hypothetical protein
LWRVGDWYFAAWRSASLEDFHRRLPFRFYELRVEDCNSGGVKPREQIGT